MPSALLEPPCGLPNWSVWPDDDEPDATTSTTPGVTFLYSCSREVVVVFAAAGSVPTTLAVADGWLESFWLAA